MVNAVWQYFKSSLIVALIQISLSFSYNQQFANITYKNEAHLL